MKKEPGEGFDSSSDEIKKPEETMTDKEKEAKSGWGEKVWQIDITPTGDSGEGSKLKTVFDSKVELEPLRCTMLQEGNGDMIFDFSSNDKGDENQRFELVINDETYATVTLKLDPEGKEAFAEARVNRDELVEAAEKSHKSKLIFRLRRCE